MELELMEINISEDSLPNILEEITDLETDFENSLNKLTEASYNFTQYYETYSSNNAIDANTIKKVMKEKVIRQVNDE